jgi:hypothetical protein
MRPRITALGVCLLAAAGCGGDYQVAPVSGRVTMDGRPMPGVYVNFQPVGGAGNPNPGPGSYAVTGADGRFTLKLVNPSREGAVVGRHRVTITRQFAEDVRGTEQTGTPDGAPASPLPRLGKAAQIPERYNVKSDLTFDVPRGGTDKADFPLTSP